MTAGPGSFSTQPPEDCPTSASDVDSEDHDDQVETVCRRPTGHRPTLRPPERFARLMD